MRRLALVALLMLTPLFAVACGGEDPMGTESSPQAQVGQPDPALPMDINQIPYKPGERVALGNAEITIGIPEFGENDIFSFNVSLTSGALESFSVMPEMFRVYTLDGKSYTPVTVGEIPRFGSHTLRSTESYSATLAVKITTGSEPALFVADLSSLGERFFPGAWVFDPNFAPQPNNE